MLQKIPDSEVRELFFFEVRNKCIECQDLNLDDLVYQVFIATYLSDGWLTVFRRIFDIFIAT